MSSFRRVIAGLSITLLSAGAFALQADARTVSASAGISALPGTSACFTVTVISGIAGVTNSCAGSASLVIPLVVDNAGVRNVLVTGRSETNGTLTCSVQTFTFDGVAVAGPGAQTWPRIGAFQRRTFVGVNVPPGGTGQVFCTMTGNASTRVNVIDYLP